MAGSRYSLIPKAFWQYLGPAYRGLDADLDAVETAAAASGGPPVVVWDGTGAPPTRPTAPVVHWYSPTFPTTALTNDVLVRS